MATIPQFDPLTTEATSPFLAGLSEGLSRIASILNLTTTPITDSAMSEVYIGEDDRYRIYQVAAGNRLWLSDPAPVVKKNGSVITPAGANFTIDYIGGSIKFEAIARLTSGDTVTVSATRINNASTEIEDIKTDVTAVEAITAHFMGYYTSVSALETAHSTGTDGDFAIIGGTVDSIYMWDSTGSAWKDIYKAVDLSTYYTKTEADALLSNKEGTVTAHGATTASDLYYYGGRKTWQELTARVRASLLTGIDTATSAIITASDSVLSGLGKLQAQITGKPFISGTGDPTTSTVGTIGQRYVNTPTGAAFRCTTIVGEVYTWVQQGTAAEMVDASITNAKLANMANNTIKGNVSGSTGAPSDLTVENVRSIITEGTSEVDAIADGDKILIEDVSASSGSKTKHVLWSAIKTALSDVFQPVMEGGVDYADATTIAMTGNYGVFTGCAVSAQTTPDQTVKVNSGSILTPDGKRYVIDAVTSLAATAAHASSPRIDIVYVSSSGVVTYLAGTAAASPVQPATPANGTILAAITRAANDNTIAMSDITDQRDFITTASDFEDVTSVSNNSDHFTCYMGYKHTKNFSFTIANTSAKIVDLAGIPYGTCDMIMTIKATATAAVTWTLDGRTLVWPNGAPTLTAGYTYIILFSYIPLLGKWVGFAQAGAEN